MYVYKPLQTASSIRLIEVCPGSPEDTIICHLHDADTSTSPHYEAISYVWGDSSDRVRILCDGEDMTITTSLAAALRRFRPPKDAAQGRILWADSICIDQKNRPEVEQQVRIMGTIYEHAATVLIWLGEESPNTKAAWDFMVLLLERVWSHRMELLSWKPTYQGIDAASSLSAAKQASLTSTDMLTDAAQINRHFDIKSADAPEYAAIGEILSIPWFTRAWTFQESFLAKKRIFHCGQFAMEGPELAHVQLILMRLSASTGDDRYFPSHLRRIYGMIEGRDYYKESPKTKILDLLRMRRGAGCYDPRDLVYSLLGSALDVKGIEVNYKKNFEQLFAEFVVREINVSKNLSILGQVEDKDQSSSTLPSWVPDWRVHTKRRRFTDDFVKIYHSAGTSTPESYLSTDAKELVLRGFILDTITTTCADQATTKDMSKHISLKLDGNYTYTGETFNTVLLRTRCADLAIWDTPNSRARWGPDAVETINHLADVERGSAFTVFLMAMLEQNRRSSLVATQRGRLGMAPNTVEAGDVVCLMLGGEVPMILREVPGQKFVLVGECYLHGFMDGEGLVEMSASGKEAAKEGHNHIGHSLMWQDFHIV